MLAADRLLLETNLRQSAIKLREKELNLYVENFSAMATQAAVFAGFTTTCLIEIHLPPTHSVEGAESTFNAARNLMHISSIIGISANIICVSLATITSIYGSGKALRGKDGSMDEAVDQMSKERVTIIRAFAVGLAMNLLTVCCSCLLLMAPPVSYLAVTTIIFTTYFIYSNSRRIVKTFDLGQAVQLDDLTRPTKSSYASATNDDSFIESQQQTVVMSKKGGGPAQVILRTGSNKQTV